jgi:hypothetical protein
MPLQQILWPQWLSAVFPRSSIRTPTCQPHFLSSFR